MRRLVPLVLIAPMAALAHRPAEHDEGRGSTARCARKAPVVMRALLCAGAWIAAPLIALPGIARATHDQDEARSQTSAHAREEPREQPTAAAQDPSSVEGDRETPRRAVTGYLTAARDGRFDDAALYLDTSQLRSTGTAGAELARDLKIVLDRRLWIDLEALSDAPEGDTSDGLPANRELVAAFPSAQGTARVTLERLPDATGEPVWRFSSSTVARIPALYDEFGLGTLGSILPRALVEKSFLEIALWQWIGLVLLLIAAWTIAWFATTLFVRLIKPMTARTRTDVDDRLVALLLSPARLLIAIAVVRASVGLLRPSVPALEVLNDTAKALIIAAITWLAFRCVDLVAVIVEERFAKRQQLGARSLVKFGARSLKVAIGALTVLAALDTFGFDVTAIIAGLGVGGLAVALAAQKTLENVFGAVSLLADQPVRPGDFCRFGDKIGTIEDIGMRSTRVRTLDRTVISVPNAEFANLHLENFAPRDRIRLITTLGLRYETTADQLRHVIVALRAILVAHPKVLPSPLRVRFVGFGAYTLDLEVFCYVDTSDYDEFLAVREDLFLRMMDAVEASGTAFAFPSSTTYLSRDHGLDAEKAQAAEREVAQWRSSDRLMFPDFSADETARIANTADWPPNGSAAASAGSAAASAGSAAASAGSAAASAR